jgi:hypothetical protein
MRLHEGRARSTLAVLAVLAVLGVFRGKIKILSIKIVF